MKKIVLAIFVFIMSLNVFSQTDTFKVKEGSFHKVEGCITIPARYDDNDVAMAVVKIIPENINEQDRAKLYFEGNLATFIEVEQNIGETWVYLTAEVATFLRIKHPDFGATEFWFPMSLKPKQCYEMVLQNNIVAPVSSNTSLIIDTEPSGADIYIEGKHYGQTPNIIKDLPAGKYELKLEKQDYNSLTRIFVIDEGEKMSFNETLASVYYKGETQKITDNSRDKKETFTVKHSGENEIFTVNGVSFTMIKVEGGTFQMGATSEQGRDAFGAEKPVHSVMLSDYYIGETEVTQELWEAVMGNNPSRYKGLQNAVETVSWNDCKEFIYRLNKLTGKNFRLPTEAEWEYAARGGDKSMGYKYSGSNNIEDVAWYKANSNSSVRNVKRKSPNELGIYDMSGNVWEWCEDWYKSKYYKESPTNNPMGPSSGSLRVLRGGSWLSSSARHCRVSRRSSMNPDYVRYYSGLRLALSQ